MDYFNFFLGWSQEEFIRLSESVFSTALILIACFAVGMAR